MTLIEPRTVVTTTLDAETDYSSIYNNSVIPLIQFQNVPLDVALEELVQQAGLKIKISSRVVGTKVTGDFVEFNGVVVHNQKISDTNSLPDTWFVPMPDISLSWKNITAKQALLALCQKHNLIITKNNTTGLLRIEPDK
jgi:hypothetical protein